MRLLRLLLLTALFLSFKGTWAQTTYRFRNYSISDGLSQSSVTCILQDENMSLWIGTQDGLNRFDGKNFEIFNSDGTDGLESEYVKCSLKDQKGALWFGTTNGLTKYDPNTEKFKTYHLNTTAALQIESMDIDNDGQIWLATTGNGVLKFSTKTEKFIQQEGLIPARKVQSLLLASSGDLFINTEDKGLWRKGASSSKAEQLFLPGKGSLPLTINKITEARQGEGVFSTRQGLFQYEITTQVLNPIYEELDNSFGIMAISDVFYLSEENTWFVATVNKGLFSIRPDGTILQSTQDIFQKSAILFNDLSVLFRDNSGTMWVGTDRGLSSFDPKNQGFLGVGPSGNLEHGIPNPNVWSFGEDKSGKYLYIGTDKGISRFNRNTGKFEQYYRSYGTNKNLEAAEITVLSIHVIDANHVLVGCIDGLFELNIISPYEYSFREVGGFKDDETRQRHTRIYTILPYKKDKYFLATKGGVVLIDIKKKTTQVFEYNPKNPRESISLGVCRLGIKDNSGRYLFATSSGGLNVLEEKGEFLKIVPYRYNSYLTKHTKDYLSSICQTGKNEYWFGTFGSGLLYWNEKTKESRVYTKKDGLPNNVIYGVLQDGLTDLWMSTNRGLCRFNRFSGETINYTEVDGLMSNEFNLGAYLKAKNGEFYFGGIYGYNFFDPKNLTLHNPDVVVKITKLKLDKTWLKPGEEGSPLTKPLSKLDVLELSYRQRSFTVRFQSSDLSNPELVNYKYILEGTEEGEVLLGSSNELRFTSLSSGTYKLKIFARIGDGPWGSPAILNISIVSPFWASWWFILIVIAVLAIGVRLFIRKRIEDARREQVRLEMKVAQRTREIRAQNIQIERQKQQLEKEKNKVEENQRLLQIEKDKTEKLLKNIIPDEITEELKNKGRASARAYKTVSVLFTDFVGFTKIADRLTPMELVGKLDVYFRKFDEIIVENNLEKIKTIGDAYMCAGGVPVRNNTNPIDACLAALQIQDYMTKLKYDAIANDGEYWELRLGINTGEVTAGVIGSERLAYDVWGATVNQAQRMEMLGEPGKVTITGNTFKHIEPYFECTFRGKAQSKSRGLIDMYTVDRIKPELSVNGEGIYPNERFQQIVNLHHYSSINYYKAERHIMKVLEKGLSDKLHYHSIAHTKDVVKAVERIALSEGVTDEGLFLLKSAATYHDAGFVEQYDKNEPIGARMADEILPKYGYTEQHIQTIKELIFVTQIPHQPKNKLEEIMCDADLDYLGRDDFHEIADRLRRELKEHGKIDSDRKWDEIQVIFLTQHKYFTETSISTRRAKKLQNLDEVKERLERDVYPD